MKRAISRWVLGPERRQDRDCDSVTARWILLAALDVVVVLVFAAIGILVGSALL